MFMEKILMCSNSKEQKSTRHARRIVENVTDYVAASDELVSELTRFVRNDKGLSDQDKHDVTSAINTISDISSTLRKGALDFRLDSDVRHAMVEWHNDPFSE